MADNLTRRPRTAGRADRLLEEAAAVAAESVQHYFRACSLLEQVQQQQEQARAQLQEVGRCLEQLTAARQDCLHRRDELLDLARRVQDFFTGMQQRSGSRPVHNWTRLKTVGVRCTASWSRSGRIGRQSSSSWKSRAGNTPPRSRRRKATCAITEALRPAGRNRPRFGTRRSVPEAASRGSPAGQRALPVGGRPAGAGAAGQRGRGADWKQLLRQVEEAAGLLKQAEELARQDLQLAERAAAEIDAAERELGRARNFFELGISADVTKAEGLLGQARHNWAISLRAGDQPSRRRPAGRPAGASRGGARARQEQQRLDQERQRTEAAAATQFAVPPGTAAEGGPPEWPSTAGPGPEPARQRPPADRGLTPAGHL